MVSDAGGREMVLGDDSGRDDPRNEDAEEEGP